LNIKELNKQMRESFHAAGHTGRGIIFAVFDTGVNPVGWLAGKVEQVDYLASTAAFGFGNFGYNDYSDKEGHGTFIAGQLIEWCPDAEIASYKMIGLGDLKTAIDHLLCRAASDPKHRYIANMSFTTPDDTIQPYIDQLVAAGIPVFCAAGNDGQRVLDKYPTCFESPICVAALRKDGTKASFSVWHDEVDFAEWGNNVDGLALDGSTTLMSGTSMAAPNLAGKAGLLLSADFTMTEPELYERLKALATDMNAGGKDPYTGWGFVELKVPAEKELPVAEKGIKGEFLEFLYEQLGQIYVWGADGQVMSPKLIKSMENSTENYRRALELYEQRKAEGKDPILGYDCSGLISRFLEDHGFVTKKRNCNHLAAMCEKICEIGVGEMQPCDLLFRYNGTKPYFHVGVYVGGGMVIESKGRDDGVILRKLSDCEPGYWDRWGSLSCFAEAGEDEPVEDVPDMDVGEVAPYYGICTGGSVNLRSGPGTEHAKIGVLHKGDKLLVLPGEGWPQVAAVLDSRIVTGYMSDKYVGEAE